MTYLEKRPQRDEDNETDEAIVRTLARCADCYYATLRLAVGMGFSLSDKVLTVRLPPWRGQRPVSGPFGKARFPETCVTRNTSLRKGQVRMHGYGR